MFKNFRMPKRLLASLTELIDQILNKSGIKNELENEKSIEADIRLENLEEFKTITKNYEENKGIASLDEFLNEISLVSDVEEYRNRDDVITLMTIHSAKGLEFNNVFLIGMVLCILYFFVKPNIDLKRARIMDNLEK